MFSNWTVPFLHGIALNVCWLMTSSMEHLIGLYSIKSRGYVEDSEFRLNVQVTRAIVLPRTVIVIDVIGNCRGCSCRFRQHLLAN